MKYLVVLVAGAVIGAGVAFWQLNGWLRMAAFQNADHTTNNARILLNLSLMHETENHENLSNVFASILASHREMIKEDLENPISYIDMEAVLEGNRELLVKMENHLVLYPHQDCEGVEKEQIIHCHNHRQSRPKVGEVIEKLKEH